MAAEKTETPERFPNVLQALADRRALLACLASAICRAAEEQEQRPFTDVELEILDSIEAELAALDARAARFRRVVWRANGKGAANGHALPVLRNGTGGAS